MQPFRWTALLLPLLVGTGACSRDRRSEIPARAGESLLVEDSHDSGPDHRFLREMLLHHQSLTLVVHDAAERMDGSTRRDALLVDLRHDVEKDQISALLRQEFNDLTPPETPPESLASVDSLQRLRGPAYVRAFYDWVVQHHRGSIRLIDSYRPRLHHPRVRELADSLRTRNARDIERLTEAMGRG